MNGKCYRCGTDNVEVNTFSKGKPYQNETHNLCVYCAAYGTRHMVIENSEYVKTGGRGIARMFHAHDRINSKFGK